MTLDPQERVVGVSQRVDRVPGRNETRDALDQALVQWLAAAGCIAVPVPNTLSDGSIVALADWLDAVMPSMIVLSGGNDIGAFPQRDATEKYLLDWAARSRKPVLGICRGMQMMVVHCGGALVPVTGHVRVYHDLGDGGSPMGWPGRINSYHDFGVVEAPPSYTALARAADGTIEAIRHFDLPWEGWMWHPERDPARRQDIERFLSLLQ
jgi:gamma-glutamyl-gamma-aminobutyrate hydrolase PuuD